MDLSLCVVTHNDEDTIEKALQSILAHLPQGRTYELYVVDNDSQDNTLNIVDRYEQFQVITPGENVGFGAGHNLAIEKSDSHYHAIINPDIEITNDVLDQILDYMDAHSEVVMVEPTVYNPDGTMQPHPKRDPTIADLFIRLFLPNKCSKRQARYMMLEQDYSKPFRIDVASGCFMVARTKQLKKIGGFDERFFLYFEDNDLSRRIRQQGHIMNLPCGLVVHHWNRTSRKSKKVLFIMMASALKYFTKWLFKRKHPRKKEAK